MTEVPIQEAERRFAELARRAEEGETVVVTRDGHPVIDLVPHRRARRGLDFEAVERFKSRHGIARIVQDLPADFDAPLSEEILLHPLPEA